MPQRTHGPTNAAANRKPASTPPTPPTRAARSGKSSNKGGTAPSSPDGAKASISAAPSQRETTAPDAHPLAPSAIARTLRAVADALERDPALARRVAADAGLGGDGAPAEGEAHEASVPRDSATTRRPRTFRPRIVTGPDAALGPGIPDPYALRAARGEVGLRAVLEELRLGTLRAIIRAHHLDPSGRLARQNDAARLRALIVEATAAGELSSGE